MEPEPVGAPSRSTEPDPFAAAELMNSVRREEAADEPVDDPPRRKAHALLRRVTGAARAFHEATQSSGPAERAATVATDSAEMPAAPEADAPQAADLVEGSRTAEPRQATPAAAAQGQASLSGLDPADRLGVHQSEEDLLDIPAFLRRQAN